MAEVFDDRFNQVLMGVEEVEHLCTGAQWSEGPLWIEEYNSVIWSDIPNNRILSWSESEGMQVWKENVEFTNGRYRHQDNYIVHCSHGKRAIEKSDIDGSKFEVLVDNYQGRKLNSPNDVVVKSDGTIWFTDPPYGILSDAEGHKADSELVKNYVFRYDPEKKTLDVVTDLIEEPNGLAFSSDEKILYVSDTSCVLRTDGSGNHHIMKFDVVDGRSLINPRLFAEVSPGVSDGFRLDSNNWIYTSSEDSIQVFHSDGTLLGKIKVPEKIGNCTFGGPDRDFLYIAASTSLYRIHLNTRGLQTP
jgi:gluconolactonase